MGQFSIFYASVTILLQQTIPMPMPAAPTGQLLLPLANKEPSPPFPPCGLLLPLEYMEPSSLLPHCSCLSQPWLLIHPQTLFLVTSPPLPPLPSRHSAILDPSPSLSARHLPLPHTTIISPSRPKLVSGLQDRISSVCDKLLVANATSETLRGRQAAPSLPSACASLPPQL